MSEMALSPQAKAQLETVLVASLSTLINEATNHIIRQLACSTTDILDLQRLAATELRDRIIAHE